VIEDPPSPLTIFRRIVGGALVLAIVALVVELVSSGDIEWKLVALVAALATFWRAASAMYDRVLEPAGRFLWESVFAGRAISLDDEIADLEMRLADPALSPEREILAGVRLAEIHRRYRADLPRSLALLDRLLVKYPDSALLRRARGLEV
jgi:hypothetical protein